MESAWIQPGDHRYGIAPAVGDVDGAGELADRDPIREAADRDGSGDRVGPPADAVDGDRDPLVVVVHPADEFRQSGLCNCAGRFRGNQRRVSALVRGLLERVTGIEPALSAWESVPSGPVTWPDLWVRLSASGRERPLFTVVNGPLMARPSSSWSRGSSAICL